MSDSTNPTYITKTTFNRLQLYSYKTYLYTHYFLISDEFNILEIVVQIL